MKTSNSICYLCSVESWLTFTAAKEIFIFIYLINIDVAIFRQYHIDIYRNLKNDIGASLHSLLAQCLPSSQSVF